MRCYHTDASSEDEKESNHSLRVMTNRYEIQAGLVCINCLYILSSDAGCDSCVVAAGVETGDAGLVWLMSFEFTFLWNVLSIAEGLSFLSLLGVRGSLDLDLEWGVAGTESAAAHPGFCGVLGRPRLPGSVLSRSRSAASAAASAFAIQAAHLSI